MATIRQEKHGKGHRYFVEGDERVDASRPLISCSSIARYANSSGADGLMYWAADHALATGKRDGFREASDKATAFGKAIQDEIAEHISTGKHPEQPSLLFGSWYSSMQERGINWLASEMMVYHPTLQYAGTLDSIGVVDDEVTIFDWKTTNGLDSKGRRKKLGDSTHATQIAGYLLAMAQHPTHKVPLPTRAVICYLLKDIHEVVWHYVDMPAAERAFLASYELHTINEGGLYEPR